MSVIDKLMETVEADIDVLRALDRQGDTFSVTRDVDFSFRSDKEDKLRALAGFLEDYQYATVQVEANEGEYRITATIAMPIEQQVLLTVSGFMACLGELYTVEYDGWGTIAQKSR